MLVVNTVKDVLADDVAVSAVLAVTDSEDVLVSCAFILDVKESTVDGSAAVL